MHTLDTPFGTVELKPTSAHHIFVDGTAQAINAPESAQYRPGLKVNGVALSVRLDLHRQIEGEWQLGQPDDPYARYHGLHATRVHWTNARQMDASDAARRKIRKVLFPLVQTWAQSAEGKTALKEAGRKAHQLKLDAKNREIQDLVAKLAAARAERARLLLADLPEVGA